MPDPHVRAYLLGQLPPAEAEALEARYVDDDGVRASIEREEDALIEAFVDGRLDDGARAAFERVLAASPERRRRVDVVRGLMARATPVSAVAPVTASRVSWASAAWGLAAAAVLVLAVWTPWRRSPAVAPSPAAPTASAVAPVPAPAAPSAAAPTVPVLALTLSVSGTRGSGAPPRIDLPSDTALDLSLVRRGAHWAGRSITVRDVDRGTQWRGMIVAPPARATDVAGVVRVPAGALPKGDYVVAVGGVPDARYPLFVR